MTCKDDYPKPDALVLSMRRLISDVPVSARVSAVAAPLVLQASQRVLLPSLGPMVPTRADGPSADQVDQEPPKPAATLSHDPEYLEVIANLRRALAGPMRDELSSALRTMIEDRDT